ncbi:MAG: hypothetical protein QOJ68_2111, partial [Blastococcus sp.]|nr:hypothetical protein [Blastococcus sp.]
HVLAEVVVPSFWAFRASRASTDYARACATTVRSATSAS